MAEQRDQAKAEIRKFFQDHHGEIIYPSDILTGLVRDYNLDYDLICEICEELEKEGRSHPSNPAKIAE